MADLIDRQAAIDALKGLPTWWADAGGYYGGAQPPMVALLDPEDAVSAIENLPAAQSHDIARDIATIIENEKDMRVILKNAQPDAPDTNGGDIIYRQAAIDAIDEIESEVADGYGYQYEKWRKYFCELPSAQPETHDKRTETHACDCISRQVAIDALMKRDKELRNINWYDKPYAEGECRGIDEALAIVSNLPSAQPERDIPVKPIWITDSAWGIPSRQAVCPKCDYYLMKVYFIPNDTADTAHSRKVSYCGNCGQAIDWSEWEDEE